MPTRPTTTGSMPAPLISLPIHSTTRPSRRSNGSRGASDLASFSRRSSLAAKSSGSTPSTTQSCFSRVLDQRDAVGDRGMLDRDLRQRRQDLGVAARAQAVDVRGAHLLAEADRDQLGEPALDRPIEARVRLDPVDAKDGIGAGGVLVEPAGDAVQGRAVFDRLHGRAHRRADGRLGHAQMGQHARLAFGAGAAVAAHRRHDEGLEAALLQMPDRSRHDLRDVGDAAAADRDRDARSAPQVLEAARAGERLVDRGGKVGDRLPGRVLEADAQHRRQRHVREVGQIDYRKGRAEHPGASQRQSRHLAIPSTGVGSATA